MKALRRWIRKRRNRNVYKYPVRGVVLRITDENGDDIDTKRMVANFKDMDFDLPMFGDEMEDNKIIPMYFDEERHEAHIHFRYCLSIKTIALAGVSDDKVIIRDDYSAK